VGVVNPPFFIGYIDKAASYPYASIKTLCVGRGVVTRAHFFMRYFLNNSLRFYPAKKPFSIGQVENRLLGLKGATN
jgi:hypothetical protein